MESCSRRYSFPPTIEGDAPGPAWGLNRPSSSNFSGVARYISTKRLSSFSSGRAKIFPSARIGELDSAELILCGFHFTSPVFKLKQYRGRVTPGWAVGQPVSPLRQPRPAACPKLVIHNG